MTTKRLKRGSVKSSALRQKNKRCVSRIFPKLPAFSPQQEKFLLFLKFLVMFTALAAPVYIVIASGVPLAPMQRMVTDNVVFLLAASGYDIHEDGFIIDVSGAGGQFAFSISEDCTGWKSMLCLFALIMAVPSVSWKKRLAGIAAGLPLVYAGNLARITGIVALQQVFGSGAVRLVHDWLWTAGLMLVVLAVWASWMIWSGMMKISFRNAANDSNLYNTD